MTESCLLIAVPDEDLMLAKAPRSTVKRYHPLPKSGPDLKLRQIAVVTGAPAVSAAAARLFAGIAAAADDDGCAMLTNLEIAALAGNGAMLAYGSTLLRELAEHNFLEFDAVPHLATAIRITLRGEELRAELDILARRMREARRRLLAE